MAREMQSAREEQPSMKRVKLLSSIRRKICGCIILSTFGSIRKSFDGPFYSNARKKNRLPQYDMVIVHEACMVEEKSLDCLAKYLSARAPNVLEGLFVIAGDPMLEPPNTSRRKDKYTDIALLLVMHELIPSSTPMTAGEDYATTFSSTHSIECIQLFHVFQTF